MEQKVKSLLKSKGWTLAELARKSGVAYATLQNYLRDEVEPGLFKAQAVAQALGVDLQELWPSPGSVSPAGDNRLSRAIAASLIDAADRLSANLRNALQIQGLPAEAASEAAARAAAESRAAGGEGTGTRKGAKAG